MSYCVAAEDSLSDLRETVEVLLADGWELAGGVAVTSWPSNDDGTEFLFLQSLVKTTHED